MTQRTTTSGIRYAKATVNNIKGLIIVPDSWRTSIYTLNQTNIATADYSTNVITSAQWTVLENYGCIFLPAAGYRDVTAVIAAGIDGHYWSTSCERTNASSSYYLYFSAGMLKSWEPTLRYLGQSVRLVKNAQ